MASMNSPVDFGMNNTNSGNKVNSDNKSNSDNEITIGNNSGNKIIAIGTSHFILAKSNPSDDLQHWYKEDNGTIPNFALVNKATGQAIKHAAGNNHPVQLKIYCSAHVLDESILWNVSNDLGGGFRAIRMAKNTGLNLDASFGEENSESGGTVRTSTIGLWHWHGGDNQRWKIVRTLTPAPAPASACTDSMKQRAFRVFCKAHPNYFLAIENGRIILAKSNPSDDLQHWYKEDHGTIVYGYPSYAFVNKATGQAIKHAAGNTHHVQLKTYGTAHGLDESVLWNESNDLGGGFRAIRTAKDTGLNLDASFGEENSGSGGTVRTTTLGLGQWYSWDNQLWKIVPASAPAPACTDSMKQTFEVFCQAHLNYSLAIGNGRVILAKSDPSDDLQHWYKEDIDTIPSYK